MAHKIEDQRFVSEVEAIVRRLRTVADQVEYRLARGVGDNLYDGLPEHSEVAGSVINQVAVMVGNIDYRHLVDAAARADRIARGGEG